MAREYKVPENIPVLENQISLDDYLTEVAVPDAPQEVVDDRIATRMMKELAVVEGRVMENSDTAEYERNRISQWEMMVNEPLQERAIWLREQLAHYARHVRETEGRKTIDLPYGRIATRPGTAKWEVTSEFVEWAKAQQETGLLRIKYEADKTAVKQAFESWVTHDGDVLLPEGELVPGIHVTEPTEPTATITTTTKGK